ncbi:MAG: lipid-A-disaccharide synthase [Ignavibacteria bacterium]|nr:lipid-A-disaccharide synthase [Ignavibacteria bacterium]
MTHTYKQPRIFITAGEPSGDAHAARLMAAIRMQIPDVIFEGFGGPLMEMEGLRSLAHIRDLAVTGFYEVAKRYGFFSDLLKRCESVIKTNKPDMFIPVDYPGFNMRLASRVKSAHMPIVWYIAPQLWAWGERRAADLARIVDRLLVVFPFEVEFFQQYGIAADYVGHPLMEVFGEHHSERLPNRILLMPGSRRQEIAHHVPLLTTVVQRLRTSHPHYEVVVAKSANIDASHFDPLVQQGACVSTDPLGEMKTASAGLIKAGTSTLEATLSGLPFSTFYRTSFLSYHISKRLANISSVTLANLLLQRHVVKEFIQNDARAELLAHDVIDLLENHNRREAQIQAMQEVQDLLAGKGVSSAAANIVVSMLGRR